MDPDLKAWVFVVSGTAVAAVVVSVEVESLQSFAVSLCVEASADLGSSFAPHSWLGNEVLMIVDDWVRRV